MEDNIAINEYVRTGQGFIGKLIKIDKNHLNYYKIDISREITHCDNSRDNYIYTRDGFEMRHSPNIIDLIEVGDFVNGEYIIQVSKTFGLLFIETTYYDEISGEEKHNFIRQEDIKSIVTREMFNSIKYEV